MLASWLPRIWSVLPSAEKLAARPSSGPQWRMVFHGWSVVSRTNRSNPPSRGGRRGAYLELAISGPAGDVAGVLGVKLNGAGLEVDAVHVVRAPILEV